MKILAVSDRVVPELSGADLRQQFADVDTVLSCGDLPYSYLQRIGNTLGVPGFYVHGNHDQPEYLSTGNTLLEPGGWVNLDGRLVQAKGLLLAGLEGSIRYRPGAPFQYTEGEMALKIWRLVPSLVMNWLRRGRYLDILVSHAPPFGIHDGADPAHRGFRALRRFVAWFRPRYLLHGHQHTCAEDAWQTRYLSTEVLNVHPFRVIGW